RRPLRSPGAGIGHDLRGRLLSLIQVSVDRARGSIRSEVAALASVRDGKLGKVMAYSIHLIENCGAITVAQQVAAAGRERHLVAFDLQEASSVQTSWRPV